MVSKKPNGNQHKKQLCMKPTGFLVSSFLSAVDNVPHNYTVYNFRDELIELLVAQQEDMLPHLLPHLAKTTWSYQDLICDLYKEKPLRSGIDFYLCVARLFIGQPVLVLRPKINKNITPGTTGPKYVFNKTYLIESDEYQGIDNVKMRFVFNRVDYICPFYPERIASIICDGRPILKDIEKVYKDLTAIMTKMPAGKGMNAGLKLMHVHLGAVAAVAETTNFATGHSDTSVVDQPAPAMDPLIAASLRKRKSTKPVQQPKPKKAKQSDEPAPTLPTVDLSEHVSEMDIAGEK